MRMKETMGGAQGTKGAANRPRSAWLVAILGGLLASSLGLGACGEGETQTTPVDPQEEPGAAGNTDPITEGPEELLEYRGRAESPGGSWYKTCPRSWRTDSGWFCAQCYTKRHTLPDVSNCINDQTCPTYCAWNDNGHLRCGNC